MRVCKRDLDLHLDITAQGNEYERARAEQIKRNLQRMQELAVTDAAAKVRC